jgi:hypothetical protein
MNGQVFTSHIQPYFPSSNDKVLMYVCLSLDVLRNQEAWRSGLLLPHVCFSEGSGGREGPHRGTNLKPMICSWAVQMSLDDTNLVRSQQAS